MRRLESERGWGSVTNKAVKEWTCGKRGMLLVLGGLPAARYSMCTNLSADTSFNDQNSTSGQLYLYMKSMPFIGAGCSTCLGHFVSVQVEMYRLKCLNSKINTSTQNQLIII